MSPLTNEQIMRLFHLYYGCDYIFMGGVIKLLQVPLIGNHNRNDYTGENAKLLLTSLSEISDKNVLIICKAAYEGAFGDYRFDKWKVIDRKYYEDCYIKVARNGTDEYFTINKRSGEVIFWDDDTRNIDDSYYTEYFRLGIAVPLTIEAGHPNNGNTAIELGIAIEKTTT